MARVITKELALKIVDELMAREVTKRGNVHDEFAFEVNGMLIAVIRIRRSSDKDKGHDYLPRELHIGPGQAKLLAQCPLSYEQYLAILRAKGVLPSEELDE